MIHYPGGESLEEVRGEIKYIDEDNYTIHHKCSTKPGSSGSPILNLDNNALIRIHIGAEKKEDGCNLGILLSVDIKKFNEK